ncbi:MAG: hypothetical protein ABL903_04885 [Methylococcales bacterium]
MNADLNPIPNAATQATLDCLRLAVSKTLERKRRLGQYSVQWNGADPFAVGDDAPEHLRIPQQSEKTCSGEK